jgi:hypothetical protein
MGERITVYRVWWGSLRERDYLRETGVDGEDNIRRIFRK